MNFCPRSDLSHCSIWRDFTLLSTTINMFSYPSKSKCFSSEPKLHRQYKHVANPCWTNFGAPLPFKHVTFADLEKAFDSVTWFELGTSSKTKGTNVNHQLNPGSIPKLYMPDKELRFSIPAYNSVTHITKLSSWFLKENNAKTEEPGLRSWHLLHDSLIAGYEWVLDENGG